MSNPSKYGEYYWCAKVTWDISSSGEIYLWADDIKITQDGSIIFSQQEHINLILPARKWKTVYAASMFNGRAVAVEHWIDEICDENEPIKKEKLSNKNSPASNKTRIERGKMTQSLRYSVMERDGFICRLCGRGNEDKVKLHVDHIIPISAGGKTELDNLRTLCQDCNGGKRSKIPLIK